MLLYVVRFFADYYLYDWRHEATRQLARFILAMHLVILEGFP